MFTYTALSYLCTKQINSIYTNILDKRIFSCWLLYNTLIHMFTFLLSLLADHQRVSTHLSTHFMAFHKSAINTTQHESRWHRVQVNDIQYESNTRPAAACYVRVGG